MPAQVADCVSSSQVRGRMSNIAEGASGNDRFAGTTGGSSPFKRQKVDHDTAAITNTRTTAISELPHPPSTPPKKQASAMYSFAPSKSGMVIDLTAESPTSSRGSTPIKSGSGSNGIFRAANARPQAGGLAGGGPRKLVVKNLRPASTRPDPQDYFNKSWKKLDEALALIFDRNERPLLLEELYKSVENVCRQGQAKLLFDKLHYRCREHIKGPKVTGYLVYLVQEKSHVDFLKHLLPAWHLWEGQMELIKLVFLYLNQSFLVNSKTEPTIDKLRTSLFRDHIFSNPVLKDSILMGACELVSHDRRGEDESFDEKTFKDTIEMFHKLVVYTSSFEPKLLSKSQSYFLEWSDKAVAELELPDFVAKAQATFRREKERCEEYNLDSTTARDIRKQLESFLVDDRIEYLTDSHAVGILLEADETASLTALFALLQRKNHGALLRPAFEFYVEKTGEAIVFDEAKEKDMIPRLLAYKRKLDNVWIECFRKEADIGVGLREAFRKFMNATRKTKMTHGTENEKTGEMIAKYVDTLLRGGLKAVADDADGDEEMDDDAKMSQQLDQVLELFRFLNGKAVFEAFYKKDLARRLLHKTSANDWAEKAMLQRLKVECGAAFTSNLESMFRDVDTSKDENASFKTRRESRKGPDLDVNILESSAWPSYPTTTIVIPPNVESTIKDFSEYYKMRFPSRKLEWKHTLAHCQLDSWFDKKYVIVVSAMQAVVLLYFNDKGEETAVSFTELLEATKLEEKDLVRTVQSLACAKYRVLRKSTKGPEVQRTDTFTINGKFRTDKVRFKINQIQLKETKEENKETHERVAADREFETQAAIVRIMKAKQKISHTDLVTETIKALAKRGKVQPEDIKKQIDKLIDKEYMERLDDGRYEYMA